MLTLQKVASATEMARIEKLSIEDGFDQETYMLKAAEGIAKQVQEYVKTSQRKKKIVLLVGKGNNGGDALAVGSLLIKEGFEVLAFCLFSTKKCSPLNQKQKKSFEKEGGKCTFLQDVKEINLPKDGVIVDGLLGTGFQGKTEGLLAEVITFVNASKIPILAIDIPSGLNGNTGQVLGPAIKAKKTYYLGLPKAGFFIEEGYNHIGELAFVDFGLPKKYSEMAKPTFQKLEKECLSSCLPEIKRSQHKYEKGYVLALAGSKNMPGAALLCTLSALRSGAGIVRLFHTEDMHEELASSFKELLKTPISEKDYLTIFEEAKRAKSIILGPGSGSSSFFQKLLKEILEKIDLPMILDADALEPFAKDIHTYPKNLVLTPHRGEMQKCLSMKGKCKDAEFFAKVQQFVEDKKVVLVLKGAPTFVFSPKSIPIVIPIGDPAMATAGSGDVLSGVIGALLAMQLKPLDAAVCGVAIHAVAGELCAKEKSSYCVIASDLIEKLPHVFSQLSKKI